MKTEEFASDANIFRIDIDTSELQRKIHKNEISYLADGNLVIDALGNIAEEKLVSEEWIDTCNSIKTQLIKFDESCQVREPNKIIKLISKYTRDAGAVICDVGQHQLWGTQSYELKQDQRFLVSGGHGAMGFSLPAAIGASYALGTSIITISGDGAFQMNIQELQWVFREQIPITFFIMNNRSLGLIQQQQDAICEGRYHASVAEGGYLAPNFCKIGSAYGINSYQAGSQEELEKILRQIDLSKPNIVEIILDVNSRAYPKTLFGEEMHNQRPLMPEELLKKLLEE